MIKQHLTKIKSFYDFFLLESPSLYVHKKNKFTKLKQHQIIAGPELVLFSSNTMIQSHPSIGGFCQKFISVISHSYALRRCTTNQSTQFSSLFLYLNHTALFVCCVCLHLFMYLVLFVCLVFPSKSLCFMLSNLFMCLVPPSGSQLAPTLVTTIIIINLIFLSWPPPLFSPPLRAEHLTSSEESSKVFIT